MQKHLLWSCQTSNERRADTFFYCYSKWDWSPSFEHWYSSILKLHGINSQYKRVLDGVSHSFLGTHKKGHTPQKVTNKGFGHLPSAHQFKHPFGKSGPFMHFAFTWGAKMNGGSSHLLFLIFNPSVFKSTVSFRIQIHRKWGWFMLYFLHLCTKYLLWGIETE